MNTKAFNGSKTRSFKGNSKFVAINDDGNKHSPNLYEVQKSVNQSRFDRSSVFDDYCLPDHWISWNRFRKSTYVLFSYIVCNRCLYTTEVDPKIYFYVTIIFRLIPTSLIVETIKGFLLIALKLNINNHYWLWLIK